MHSTTSLFVGVIIQNFNDLKAEKDKERAGGLCVDKQMVNRLCMASQEEEEGGAANELALMGMGYNGDSQVIQTSSSTKTRMNTKTRLNTRTKKSILHK